MNVQHSEPIPISTDPPLEEHSSVNDIDRNSFERVRHDTITRLKSLNEPRKRTNSLSPGLASSTPPTFVPDGSHEISLVENYLLIEHIEGHNTGNVFRAVDYNTDKEYMCKVYQSSNYRKAIDGYYRVTPHSNLNSIVDVVVHSTKAYVFLYSGVPMLGNDECDKPASGFRAENLHSYTQSKRKLSEKEAAQLFSKVVAAVAHCHENNIVLRDLKLRKFVFKDVERTDIFLESLDDAFVLETNDDYMLDRRGCPAYASPEVLSSAACGDSSSKLSRSEPVHSNSTAYRGKASDIWSLGVMLYTMLVGRYPFYGPDPISMFSKISRGQFKMPESLSSEARDLIKNLLRKQPSQRMTAQHILDHPWLKRKGECWDAPQSRLSLGSGGDKRRVDKTILHEVGRHSGGHSFPPSLYSIPYYDDQAVPATVLTDRSQELVFSFGE